MTNPAMDRPPPKIDRDDLNLSAAERPLCGAALEFAGNIVGAAELLSACRVTPKHRKRRAAPPSAAGARRTLDLPGQRP